MIGGFHFVVSNPETHSYWSADPRGECTIVLDEVGDVGEVVRGTFEATLTNEVEENGLGTTWTSSSGTLEFVRQPTR